MRGWGGFFTLLLLAAIGFFIYQLGLWEHKIKPRLYQWMELEQPHYATIADSILQVQKQQPLLDSLSNSGDSMQVEQEMQKNLIEQDLKTLDKMKKEIDSLLTLENADQAANLKKLAKIYEAMRPNEVAQLSLSIDDSILARILAIMKPRNAARVLGEITRQDPAKSAQLSKMILKLRAGQ